MQEKPKGKIKIVRSKSNFTVIPNEMIRRKDLSWKAKGLMTFLLSMSENWNVYKSDLANRSTDGYQSMLSGWEELEKHGYIETIRVKKGNLFSGYEYLIHEVPVVGVFVNTNNREPENHQLINTNNNKEQNKGLNINTGSEEEPVIKPLTLYQLIVEYWLKVYHPTWTFEAIHGKKVKSLITKIKKLLANGNFEVSEEKVLDLFKSMCQNMPEYYRDKDLAVIDSKFNEITTEIIKNKNGTKSSNQQSKPIERYSPFATRS